MKIKTIEIKNFRMLKDIKIEPEAVMSLIIGKNNSGKTSVLDILNFFLKDGGFSFDDFNISTHENFKKLLGASKEDIPDVLDSVKIELKIYIEYTDEDTLENFFGLHGNLDPQNNFFVFAFEYGLRTDRLGELRDAFGKFMAKADNAQKTIIDYLKKNIKTYCQIKIKTQEYGNEDISTEIEFKNVIKVIRFEAIGAKRRVSEDKNSYNLSTIVSSYYKNNAKQDAFLDKKEELEATLSKIDDTLTDCYPTTFEGLLRTLKQFGVKDESSSSDIQIVSDISSHNIITNSSKVVYEQGDYQLPESYNGLGYINLIYMILEIHNKLDSFKANDTQKSADINLLFIEEPEAHMHPQMQYIFIHHIKEMLTTKSKELGINLQTIISTHSPHIASQSEFSDIKYFDISGQKPVEVKSISDFMKDEGPENRMFLTRYLTVHNSELFFASKAILIEGPTERLLLPFMMRKIDDGKEKIEDKLLSQNVSIIEVGGAYAHKFRGLLKFLNIRTLIITDLDSIGDDGKKCEVGVGTKTSNQAIKDYLGDNPLKDLIELSAENKVVDGLFRMTYQIPDVESGYNARTFEDAWIEINKEFINSESTSLNDFPHNVEESKSSYDLADKIKKKTEFALDIIFSTKEENQWNTPRYIREGLKWLAN